MRELFCSLVSGIIFRSLSVFFIFLFGVVGATLGGIAGVVIGWRSNKMWVMHTLIRGVVAGAVLSFKLTKATFDYLFSDDAHELVFFLHMVKLITNDLEKILGHDEREVKGFNKAPIGKGYSSMHSRKQCQWSSSTPYPSLSTKCVSFSDRKENVIKSFTTN